MDLSKLSDQELEAIVAQGQKTNTPDVSSMSDEELLAIISQGNGERAGRGAAQTALESFGRGATLGYLPHLQAMAEPILSRAYNLLPGPDVEPAPWSQMNPYSPEYVAARDANIRRQQEQAAANPTIATVGELAGVAATSAIPGAGVARAARAARAGSMGQAAIQAGRSAAQGAAMGAAVNPGDVEGEVNPLQIPERLENAQTGAMFGAGAGALGSSAKAAAPKLKDAAERLAFKASGAMLKDFRQYASRGELEKLGRFMLDKGIVKAGDTVDDVARKASEVMKEAGKRLDEVYSTVEKKMAKVYEKVSNRWQELSPKEFSMWKNLGFNPVRDKGKIMAQARKALGDETDAKAALARLETYLDDLTERYGDQILTPRQANDVKSAIDRAINYTRNPLTREPGAETAWKATRTFLSRKIEKQVATIAKEVGDKNAAKALKAANRDYGYAKRITQIAQDRVNRNAANNAFGLPDYIIGGGATAGGLAMGGIPGAAAGLAGLAATKAARKYGTSVAATGLDALSRAASRGAGVPEAAAMPLLRMNLSPGFAEDESANPYDDIMLSRGGK